MAKLKKVVIKIHDDGAVEIIAQDRVLPLCFNILMAAKLKYTPGIKRFGKAGRMAGGGWREYNPVDYVK